MNTQHLKYAVEVERTGSITQAADNLYMAQPNLSKAIKELEDTLGISIFRRTSKGVVPTEKGAEFLVYAKRILTQLEKVEALNARAKDAESHLNRERRERALEGVSALRHGAETVGSLRVVTHTYDSLPADALRDVASALIEAPDTVALLADRTETGCLLLFARAENVALHVGKLLSEAAKAFGGKGGGRSDFAQGAAASTEAVHFALARIRDGSAT